jgi:ABC-2 type transport system ATP-binding protein
MSDVVDVHDLVKTFGHVRALDRLELQVTAGQVHGFLGPNAAGKSTTIRVLLGLLRVESGTVRVLGSDPWADATRLHRRLAYVPGDVTLWPNLSGGGVIDLLSGRRSRSTPTTCKACWRGWPPRRRSRRRNPAP